MGWLACISAVLMLAWAMVSGRAAYSETAPNYSLNASDAWVRLAAAPGRPAAGYLVLENKGPTDRLVSVTSSGARIEIHRTTNVNGISRMQRLDGLDVPAGRVAFRPGGLHLMIFGSSAKPGSPMPLQLRFTSGRVIDMQARTVAAGGAVHAH